MKHKKNTRMCAACRERGEKDAFFRITRTAGGSGACIDHLHKMQGRGAYVCRKENCIGKARKTRVLSRSLGCAVPDGLFEEMSRLINEK